MCDAQRHTQVSRKHAQTAALQKASLSHPRDDGDDDDEEDEEVDVDVCVLLYTRVWLSLLIHIQVFIYTSSTRHPFVLSNRTGVTLSWTQKEEEKETDALVLKWVREWVCE